jgi:hypothetical protein
MDGPKPATWRRDGLALVFAMLFPSLGTWLYFVTFAGQESMKAVYSASKLIQFVFPVVWIWWVQRRAIRLAWPTRAGVGMGLAFGGVVAGAMLVLYALFLRGSGYLAGADSAIWTMLTNIGADEPWKFLLLAAFYSLPHAFFEEYYWRWFVFGELRRLVAWPLAAGVSGVAFALHHVIVIAAYLPREHFWTATLFFSLCVGVGGAVWAWLYQKSGSLYGPWLSHVLIDVGIMIIAFDLCRRYWTP